MVAGLSAQHAFIADGGQGLLAGTSDGGTTWAPVSFG
jgi:hypothetical protein